MIEITVYGKPGCHQCRLTTKVLEGSGLEYIYHDVTTDPSHADVVRFLGYQSLPVVLVGDMHWSGFRADKLNRLTKILQGDRLKILNQAAISLEREAIDYVTKEMAG